ncbi:MAG: hypothetical protein JWM21_1325 [Acidobacteria bacterium]|nr:hypothetical protein [Acidobacteriota bacterium]
MPVFPIEQIKLIFDHTKHITTLSVGSMVAIVTFYEKLGGSRHWKTLVSISLVCFVISILAGIVAQFGVIDSVEKAKVSDPRTRRAFIVTYVSFSLALVGLCVYGLRNF